MGSDTHLRRQWVDERGAREWPQNHAGGLTRTPRPDRHARLQDYDTDYLFSNLASYNQRIMGPEHGRRSQSGPTPHRRSPPAASIAGAPPALSSRTSASSLGTAAGLDAGGM
jgi:hypothetical protein